jgi:hypothetical protein
VASLTHTVLRSAALCLASAFAVAVFAAPTHEAAPGRADIDALVSYETRQTMPSGVTRVDTWQERLVRRGEQVWTERVLPGHHPAHASTAERAGHPHLNAQTAARWLRVNARGEVELKLVDRENKVVVDVPKAEFASVSFDGRVDAAASLVPPAVVQTMAAAGAATAAGQWRSERNQGWTHRVRWSEAKQIALRTESRRDDGSFTRRVTVTLRPVAAGAAAPWDALAGYQLRQYDEYMD